MTLNGFIPLNKPLGLTSQQAVSRVKRILGCKKAGHTGTLDPAAEGLLVIALGSATRLSEYFLDGDKGYRAEITFGIATDSCDREGAVTKVQDQFSIGLAQVEKVLEGFKGVITQVPPVASAIKLNGKRAYKLYREGQTPEMPSRQVTIHKLKSIKPAPEITPANPVLVIDVICSKGTYIRSLARDIGAALDCPSHMSALVRTSVSQITLDQAATLEDLEIGFKPWLLDMSIAVQKLGKIELNQDQSRLFSHGRTLTIPCPDGDVAIFSGPHLLGVALASAGTIKPTKVLVQE